MFNTNPAVAKCRTKLANKFLACPFLFVKIKLINCVPVPFYSLKHPELLRDRRCRLVVFGIEVGGRWSDEAATFLRLLAHTKARQAPALLRHSLTNALIHRWSAMLTHAAMHAFAASLLDQDLSGCHNLDGNTPSISEILAEVTSPPHYSRLPALL